MPMPKFMKFNEDGCKCGDAACGEDLVNQMQKMGGNSASAALGFKWKETGSEKPATGTEIKNELLAEALQKQVEFKKEEWDKFKVADLSTESYIKVGENRYFKPDRGELRFPVGTRVLANVGTWKPGIVIRHWDDGNAYRVDVDGVGNVWARYDVDDLIRPCEDALTPPPPLSPHQAEQSEEMVARGLVNLLERAVGKSERGKRTGPGGDNVERARTGKGGEGTGKLRRRPKEAVKVEGEGSGERGDAEKKPHRIIFWASCLFAIWVFEQLWPSLTGALKTATSFRESTSGRTNPKAHRRHTRVEGPGGFQAKNPRSKKN